MINLNLPPAHASLNNMSILSLLRICMGSLRLPDPLDRSYHFLVLGVPVYMEWVLFLRFLVAVRSHTSTYGSEVPSASAAGKFLHW